MEKLDKTEKSILESLGRQPLHLRMIHRIVNDRTEENISRRDVRTRLDRLCEDELVVKDGEYYSKEEELEE